MSSIYPSIPTLSPSSVTLLPFFLLPSCLFDLLSFPSKGKLPPLHRRGLIFHFQITVVLPLSFSALSFFTVLRDKHEGKLRHNVHVDI